MSDWDSALLLARRTRKILSRHPGLMITRRHYVGHVIDHCNEPSTRPWRWSGAGSFTDRSKTEWVCDCGRHWVLVPGPYPYSDKAVPGPWWANAHDEVEEK